MLTHYTSLQQTMSESYASLYIDSICSANFFTTAYRFSFRVGPTSGSGEAGERERQGEGERQGDEEGRGRGEAGGGGGQGEGQGERQGGWCTVAL